jgi:hypothetical protein
MHLVFYLDVLIRPSFANEGPVWYNLPVLVRTHARTHARTHTHTHARMHARTHEHTHNTHTLSLTHTHTHAHTHTHCQWRVRHHSPVNLVFVYCLKSEFTSCTGNSHLPLRFSIGPVTLHYEYNTPRLIYSCTFAINHDRVCIHVYTKHTQPACGYYTSSAS